jgi:hypothetical protein
VPFFCFFFCFGRFNKEKARKEIVTSPQKGKNWTIELPRFKKANANLSQKKMTSKIFFIIIGASCLTLLKGNIDHYHFLVNVFLFLSSFSCRYYIFYSCQFNIFPLSLYSKNRDKTFGQRHIDLQFVKSSLMFYQSLNLLLFNQHCSNRSHILKFQHQFIIK